MMSKPKILGLHHLKLHTSKDGKVRFGIGIINSIGTFSMQLKVDKKFVSGYSEGTVSKRQVLDHVLSKSHRLRNQTFESVTILPVPMKLKDRMSKRDYICNIIVS